MKRYLSCLNTEETKMTIRTATESDLKILCDHDKHISAAEHRNIIGLKRVLIAEDNGKFIGWLRWNLFWDNIPFMTMLYIIEDYRNMGIGTSLVKTWEDLMNKENYRMLLTSSLSDETAQHFYRKLGYRDSGSIILPGEALEIIFLKEI